MARPEITAEQKEAKRETILAAAREVFAEKGFHAAGIADIAMRLDVGHGTIYRYFKNKLDIFLTLYDAINADLLRIARGTRPEQASNTDEYIAEMQKFYSEFGGIFLRELSHLSIFFDEVHADPEIQASGAVLRDGEVALLHVGEELHRHVDVVPLRRPALELVIARVPISEPHLRDEVGRDVLVLGEVAVEGEEDERVLLGARPASRPPDVAASAPDRAAARLHPQA
mgnify:CR=1 FL=1